MRKTISLDIENGRITTGKFGTKVGSGPVGAFLFKKNRGAMGTLVCIVSTDNGWEQVSIQRKDKPPTLDDLRYVRNLFWDADEPVLVYVGAKVHDPNSTHLWRPLKHIVPLPPEFG